MEINERGSTIFLDWGRRGKVAPAVKKDVDFSEDDLYNATPQPPARKASSLRGRVVFDQRRSQHCGVWDQFM